MINAGISTKEWAEQNSFKVFYSEFIDSTNSQAKRDGIVSDTHPWLYVCGEQSQGRGRGDKTWSNTHSGQQLLSTWCYPLTSAPQPIAVPLCGWAIYQALNDEFDVRLGMKAPNDICSEMRKLAGVLIESVSMGDRHAIYIGLGLNVNEAPTGVGPATCLNEEIGAEVSTTRWHNFLSKLSFRFDEAISECTVPELSVSSRNKILASLQKWPQNQVEKLLSNGDLVLRDSTRIPWNQL